MKKVILRIDGMSCSACQNRVEKYLNKQDGVKASVNLVLAQALIEYDDKKVSLEDLDRFVEESGYKSLGVYKEEKEKVDNTKYYLIIFAILLLVLMCVSMSHMFIMNINHIYYGVSLLILTIPFIVFGFDILKSGITKLLHPNMDSLVSIGVLSSLIYSLINLILIIDGNHTLVDHLYFESSAMIIYFIKLGRFIDKKSKEKTKEAIKELVTITPEYAIIKKDGKENKVTIDEVKVGDILICRPGMKIAVDGVITKGDTHTDEAFITGESIPSKKKINDKVVAGSINIDGYIEYKAERIGPESTISEIVRLVVEAANTKPSIQRIVDKVSGIFVPIIFLISLLTLFGYLISGHTFNESIISFVTVLVVACPCALGLATPLAVVVSIGHNAKDGILIKNSETLENIHKVNTIVFDKTGTLTKGKLEISKINNYSKYDNEELLKVISSIEKLSSHPIKTAFNNIDGNYEVKDFKNIPGTGLYGIVNKKEIYIGSNKLFKELDLKNNYTKDEDKLLKDGNSIIYVIENKKVIALIGVKDILRVSAKRTVKELKRLGMNVIMLSGDNKLTANLIGKELEIDNVIANVLPKEKEEVLKDLMNKGNFVMMVGDGINDAPSLASSNIGVSINGGTDIAADSADVILMHDDLYKIVDLLNNSKKAIRIIKENLFWAFIYNILMIPIAMGLFKNIGISISPMIASISMTISSLTVVFNSLRLRK